MKLRKLFLGTSGVVLSLFGLASCSGEVTLKGEYPNTDQEMKEVEIKQSNNEEDVLDTMKFLAYNGEKFNEDINTISWDMNVYMDGTAYNQAYKFDSQTKFIADLNSNDFSIYLNADTTVLSKTSNMKMGIYGIGSYVYYESEQAGVKSKYRLSGASLDSAYKEMMKTVKNYAKENSSNNLSSIFEFMSVYNKNGMTPFETIMDTEDMIRSYISTYEMKVSSVTNDYIYLSLNLDGDAISTFCKENDLGINDLNGIFNVDSNDRMSYIVGFDTKNYMPSYLKIDFTEAKDLLSQIVTSIAIDSYNIEMWVSFNKDNVEAPSDLDSYKSYNF